MTSRPVRTAGRSTCWRAGTSSLGTVAWDGAGNIVFGRRRRDQQQRCLHARGQHDDTAHLDRGPFEHSDRIRRHGRSALAADRRAAPGNCAVLEGSSEDKLVVYFSTSGTGGPWTVAQTLTEGVELPTGWTHKLINLAGVPAVSNNPNFALRFQWQFNQRIGHRTRGQRPRAQRRRHGAPSRNRLRSAASSNARCPRVDSARRHSQGNQHRRRHFEFQRAR